MYHFTLVTIGIALVIQAHDLGQLSYVSTFKTTEAQGIFIAFLPDLT